MRNVVDNYARAVFDGIPRYISQKRNLTDMPYAFQEFIFLKTRTSLIAISGNSPYHRASFDEFFFLELSLALRKPGVLLEQGFSFPVGETY
jgi:ATP-dependent DNA helicase RecG